MKVVAFNGSPRREGNTAHGLRIIMAELEAAGIETELVQVGANPPQGCISCYSCHRQALGKCAITADYVNEWVEKISAADGILLGSPVYFHNITGQMKSFIDRVGFVARGNGRMFTGKIAGGLMTVRRAGAVSALDAMLNFFMVMQMYVAGGTNIIATGKSGDLAKDEEGVGRAAVIGKNMAAFLHMKEVYQKKGK